MSDKHEEGSTHWTCGNNRGYCCVCVLHNCRNVKPDGKNADECIYCEVSRLTCDAMDKCCEKCTHTEISSLEDDPQ